MKFKFVIIVLLCVMASGCASSLQSPCDQYATYCGAKTKINHW